MAQCEQIKLSPQASKNTLALKLAVATVVGLIAFLAVYSIFDSRSLYTDTQESSPVGSVAAVASLGLLVLCIGSVILALYDRTVRLGAVQFATFFVFSVLYLCRLTQDGFVASAGTLLVVALLFAVSVQAAYSGAIFEVVAWSLRLLLIASLVSVLVAPDWALVPADRAGRALFGLDTRLIGFSASPNYLAVGAGALILLELLRPSRAAHSLRFLFLAICVVVLLWTQSRSVILGVGLALVIFLLTRKSVHQPLLFVATAWSLILLSVFVPSLSLYNNEILGIELDEFTTGRTDIWSMAWSSIDAYWKIGVPTSESRLILGGASNAHNQFLEILMTGGFVLLLSILALLVTLSVVILRSNSRVPLAGALFVYICAQFIFGTPLRVSGLSWNLLLLTLLIIQVSALQHSSMPRFRQPAQAAVRNFADK